MLRVRRPAIVLTLVLLLSGLTHAAEPAFQFSSRPVAMKNKLGDSWDTQPTRLLVAAPEAGDALDEYGGSLDWPAERASGFFRTQKIGGRWWLIDPEGRRFIHAGVAGVNVPGNSEQGKAAVAERFGSGGNWARSVAPFLKEYGFNGLGAWANVFFLSRPDYKLPQARLVNFMGDYGRQRGKVRQIEGHLGYPENAIPVFEPEFIVFAEQYAQKLASEASNPWLIGWFTDNEMPLYDWTLDGFLRLPVDDVGRREALRWLAERQQRSEANPRAITRDDRLAFVGHVYETYLGIVETALRKADPNHLFLGTRLHYDDFRNPYALQASGRHVDVMSVNFYREWAPSKSLLRDWERWTGKPVIISEWYTKGEDSGLPNKAGAGAIVKTQVDRGDHYQHFTLALLESSNVVGWHWLQYQDNDPDGFSTDPGNKDANKGLLNIRFQPYTELLERAKRVNLHKYGLARQFDAARVAP